MSMLHHWFKRVLTLLCAGVLCVGLVMTGMQPAISALPPGNAVNDPRALLRLSLPIENENIRKIQLYLEGTSPQLRGKRWPEITAVLGKASSLLGRTSENILADVDDADQAEAKQLLSGIQTGLVELKELSTEHEPRPFKQARAPLLQKIGELEALMVHDFPFEVPEEYSNLPQLKGRATVELETNKGVITVVVDGFSAPITAGNFVDLVQRGFYDGLPFTREEESYVVQAGDPDGPDAGFRDPETGDIRTIPIEIMRQGEPEPIYGFTMEELGIYPVNPVLPFSSYGTLAMAAPFDDPNGGSSQFFFLKFEAELTPAGANLLDGLHSVFGYTVDGQEVLRKIKKGDVIKSARVIQGGENLVA